MMKFGDYNGYTLPLGLLCASSFALLYWYNQSKRALINSGLDDNRYVQAIKDAVDIDSALSTLLFNGCNNNAVEEKEQVDEREHERHRDIEIIIVHDPSIPLDQIDQVALYLYNKSQSIKRLVELKQQQSKNRNSHQTNLKIYSIAKQEFVHYDPHNTSKNVIKMIITIDTCFPNSTFTLLQQNAKAALLLSNDHPFINIYDHNISKDSATNPPLTTQNIDLVLGLSGFKDTKSKQFINGHNLTMVTSVSPSWSIGHSDTIKLNNS